MSSPTKELKVQHIKSIQLAKNLQQLIREFGITESFLAQELELPVMTIRRLTSGETTDPRISTLKMIADYFKLSLDSLLGERNGKSISQMGKSKPQFIPILDWTTAAQISSVNEIDLASWKTWHPVTFSSEIKLSSGAFILESTPSINIRYPMGTLFVIDPAVTVLDGDIVLVRRKESDDIFLRELSIYLPEKKLLSLIPDSPHIIFSEEEYSIVGVVVLTLLYKRKADVINA